MLRVLHHCVASVPQAGKLRVVTELGVLDVYPCEIVVIQRGIRFSVQVPNQSLSLSMISSVIFAMDN